MPSWLVGAALALSVVGLGLAGGSAWGIESDRDAAQEAERLLDAATERLRRSRDEARARGDSVEQARAERALGELSMVRRRTNPGAMLRQVRARYESFRDHGIRMAAYGLVIGEGGLGIGELYDILLTLDAEESEDAWALVETLQQGIGRVEGGRRLPSELGDYVAVLATQRALGELEHPETIPEDELSRHVCQQVRRALSAEIAASRSLDAQRALQAAIARVCAADELRGRLEMPAEIQRLDLTFPRNEVVLRPQPAEPGETARVEGTIAVTAEFGPQAIQAFSEIGAAAGGAAAGALGRGDDDDDEPSGERDDRVRGCRVWIEVVLALSGEGTPERFAGDSRPEVSVLHMRCPGRSRDRDAPELRGPWSAVRQGDGYLFEITINRTPMQARLSGG